MCESTDAPGGGGGGGGGGCGSPVQEGPLTTSTLIFFSPYTDSPGTMFLVTSASSLPRAMNTPVS